MTVEAGKDNIRIDPGNGRVPMIVGYMIDRRWSKKPIPDEIKASVLSSLSGAISPVEDQFRGRWNRDASLVAEARKAILANIYRRLRLGETEDNPEIDALNQAMQDLNENHGISNDRFRHFLKNVVEDTFVALKANWNSPDEIGKYIGKTAAFVAPGQTRYTRGIGADVNPPQSRDAWRRS